MVSMFSCIRLCEFCLELLRFISRVWLACFSVWLFSEWGLGLENLILSAGKLCSTMGGFIGNLVLFFFFLIVLMQWFITRVQLLQPPFVFLQLKLISYVLISKDSFSCLASGYVIFDSCIYWSRVGSGYNICIRLREVQMFLKQFVSS